MNQWKNFIQKFHLNFQNSFVNFNSDTRIFIINFDSDSRIEIELELKLNEISILIKILGFFSMQFRLFYFDSRILIGILIHYS